MTDTHIHIPRDAAIKVSCKDFTKEPEQHKFAVIKLEVGLEELSIFVQSPTHLQQITDEILVAARPVFLDWNSREVDQILQTVGPRT